LTYEIESRLIYALTRAASGVGNQNKKVWHFEIGSWFRMMSALSKHERYPDERITDTNLQDE